MFKGLKMKLIATFAAGLACVASGGVATVGSAPKIDGVLDDACWSEAKWEGGFKRKADSRSQTVTDAAEYALATDGKTLFFAIRCHCTDFAKVKARPKQGMWTSDTVEFFFAPTGAPDDFYQFAADYQGKRTFCQYYGEAGHITPDPYAPDWKMEVGDLPDGKGWCAEGAIPLSGLYMTRNRDWKTEWLFNIGWCNRTMGEVTTLSGRSFREPKRFLRGSGFPMRAAGDDFSATELSAKFDGCADGKFLGELTMKVFAGLGGEYTLASQYLPEPMKINLKSGINIVKARCAYPEKGRRQTELVFTRTADGAAFRRGYPVFVDFEPIVVRLTKPGYRNNFYPGQDASAVEGTVKAANGSKAKLTLEGPGFGRKACEAAADGTFRFDTAGFTTGDAWLTVTAGGETAKVRIRNLPPTGHSMSWVENKRIVVDGKPVFGRKLSAPGYMGGEALLKKYKAADMRESAQCRRFIGMEPRRLVKGIELREAVRDVQPGEDLLRKFDEVIAKHKDEDFTGYYLCDEPECRNVSPVYLMHCYRYIAEKDPYHIIRVASRSAAAYFICADLVESHDYLNLFIDEDGKRDWRVSPAMIADRIAGHAAAQIPDKVLGCYSTCFAYRWQSYRNDYPTFDEYLSSTFAGIVNNAKSLQAYAYHDMGDRPATWHGYKYVNWSIAALEDLLLADCEVLAKTKDWQCTRFAVGEESMFVLVNFTRNPQQASVPQLKGRYFEFRGDRTFDGTTFALKPLEVLIGTSSKRDAGLPSYAETAALVTREETARKSRDNQLRGRYEDVVFSVPGVKRFVTSDYKLIDGTLDVISGSFEHSTNAVCEMSFRNGLKPVFDTVRIYGCNVGNAVVEIRKGGAWRTLEPSGRRTEEYLCELAFPAAYSTVKMRIRFPFAKRGRNRVELYEIELPRATRKLAAGEAAPAAKESAAKTPAEPPLWTVANVSTREKTWVKYFKFDAAHPWLVMDAKFTHLVQKGYESWVMACGEPKVGGAVKRFVDGLYTLRVPEGTAGKTKVKFWLKNVGLDLLRLSCERKPANLLSAELVGGAGYVAAGETIRIRLDLAEPCEDVTVKLALCGRRTAFAPFKVNGSDAVELKALDGTGRNWGANVEVKTCGEAKAREVYAVASVLGGGLDRPILTNFTVPFKK